MSLHCLKGPDVVQERIVKSSGRFLAGVFEARPNGRIDATLRREVWKPLARRRSMRDEASDAEKLL